MAVSWHVCINAVGNQCRQCDILSLIDQCVRHAYCLRFLFFCWSRYLSLSCQSFWLGIFHGINVHDKCSIEVEYLFECVFDGLFALCAINLRPSTFRNCGWIWQRPTTPHTHTHTQILCKVAVTLTHSRCFTAISTIHYFNMNGANSTHLLLLLLLLLDLFILLLISNDRHCIFYKIAQMISSQKYTIFGWLARTEHGANVIQITWWLYICKWTGKWQRNWAHQVSGYLSFVQTRRQNRNKKGSCRLQK